MKINSYSIESPRKGIFKQYTVCAYTENGLFPLIYLRRPVWIKSDAKWEKMVKSIRLDLKDGFAIE